MAFLAESMKTNPALKRDADTKVELTVGKMISLLQSFHARGYKDAKESKPLFEQIFG